MAAPVRIGFIGAGKMASALASGLVRQGQVLKNSSDLMASCPVQDNHLLEPFKGKLIYIFKMADFEILIQVVNQFHDFFTSSRTWLSYHQ